MPVTRLDAPDSRDCESIRLDFPHWELIETAIRRLNGINFSEVAIVTREATGMSINGGWNGNVLVEIIENSESVSEFGTTSDDRTVAITPEGDGYPVSWVVGIEAAVLQAKNYFDSNTHD